MPNDADQTGVRHAPDASSADKARAQPLSNAEWKQAQRELALRMRAYEAAKAAGEAAIARGADRDEVGRVMHAARERVMPSARALVPVAPAALPALSGDGWTLEKKRAFLLHLAATGCISQACAYVGLSRQSAYKLRHRTPNSVFALAWSVAIEISRQALLDEATERAFQGSETAVWYHGEQVGTRIVHNDRLLMFLLRHKREPVHSVLDTAELISMFPEMIETADQTLGSPLSGERLQELKEEYDWRGFSGQYDDDEPEDEEDEEDEDWEDEDWEDDDAFEDSLEDGEPGDDA